MKILDFSYINEISGFDKSQVKDLLNILIIELKQEENAFNLYYDKKDKDGIYDVIHKTKYKLKMLKLDFFLSLAEEIEKEVLESIFSDGKIILYKKELSSLINNLLKEVE